MNKMKKLLSVLLAVLMILSSMTVMASAAKTSYKSTADLDALDAYSDYGKVTRLSSEERMSIVFDYLDMVLPGLNIDMGTVVDAAGITIKIDFTSVDNLCSSIDSFKNSMNGFAWGFASAFVNLGVLEDLNFDSWATGMTRDGTAQLTIIQEVAQLLTANKDVVYDIISTGNLDLGIVSSLANINIDLSIIADIPGLIKGLIYPLLERKDDTIAEAEALQTYSKGNGNVEAVINNFVQGLFTKPQSTTTVKFAADGTTVTSAHQGFYNAFSDTYRYKYTMNSDASPKSITSWIYTYNDAAGTWSYVEEKTFYLSEEYIGDVATGDWVYTADDGTNIKWYEDNSYWLHEQVNIDLSTMSAADLLYTFVPIVFEKMAPVVLNGSIKMMLAELFGATKVYIGDVGSDEVAALADSSNAFFTEEQGDYLWEWSNYAVINGTHYYRFEDQIFRMDTSNTNKYFNIINYDYEITGDWMDEFVPANGGSTSDTLLENLNDFLVKTATEVLDLDYINANKASTVPTVTFETGSNAVLVQNIKEVAQAVISIQPESIFGSDYDTESYYKMMIVTDNDQTVLTGIAATVVDWLMPQMILPSADSMIAQGASVGAILASVLRELATQLIPENNYDALIYSDYNTKTFLSGKDNAYWLDVILTMGVDIGIEYLHNLADMGGDTDYLKSIGWNHGKVYSAMSQTELKAYWEGVAGYILDWALGTDEYQWRMSKMVDAGSATDFWGRLDYILDALLPADEVFNVTVTDAASGTELEQLLRHDIILSLVNLEWENITEVVRIPDGFLRTDNVLDQLATVLKNIINGLFKKVGGGSYSLIPAAVTDFDTLANQSNLAAMIRDLIGALETAYNNGLMDVVLPFINFFLGWKTDAQKYAEPSITFANPNNLPYIYSDGTTVSTTLNISNMSAGMLERHRAPDGSQWSSVTDQDYVLTIQSVTCDDAGITASGLPVTVNPYGTAAIAVSGAYTSDKVVKFTITYTFTGKDGTAIGGTQTTQTYMYVCNDLDENYEVAAHTDGWKCKTTAISKADAVRVQREAFNAIKYGANAKALIDNFTITFTNNSESDYSEWVYSSTGSNLPAYVTANQSYVHGCNENATLKANHQGWMNKGEKVTSNTVNPLTWVSGTDTTDMVSGWVSANLGSLATIWHNHKKDGNFGMGDGGDVKVTINTSDLGYLYIVNTAGLGSKADSYAGVMSTEYDLTTEAGQAAWNTFETALKNAYKVANQPYMRDAATFTNTFGVANQEALALALDEAYEALAEYALAGGSAMASDTASIEAALAKDVELTGYEINFQDYDLYEYWNYEDYRTLARNILKDLTPPELLDTYYIAGSGIREAELDDVIAAEANDYIAAGITASRSENTAEAIAASQEAIDNYVAPYYSDLNLEDIAVKLNYYRQFLISDENGSVSNGYDSLYFLDKEIKYAAAQNYVEDDYTVDTWAAYEKALAYANEVLAGTAKNSQLPSTVFEAKYNLMVAENNLMLKSRSSIYNGYTAELEANIELAEAIFAGLENGTYWVAEGVNENEAYAALIKALGYYYVGQDGETYNLYADSAYELADNDRPINKSNENNINTANDNLVAAMALFETAAAEPNTIMLKEGAPYEAIIDLVNCGDYNGTIYGIDTLGWDDTMEADGTLADFLTTAYGDEYLQIVVGDAGVETTGTFINVLDEDGNVVETYVFVYFGDVDMDGLVGASDAFACEYYEMNYTGIDTLYQFMAGDLDGDTLPGAADAYTMEYYEMNYTGMSEQAEIGAVASGNEYIIF